LLYYVIYKNLSYNLAYDKFQINNSILTAASGIIFIQSAPTFNQANHSLVLRRRRLSAKMRLWDRVSIEPCVIEPIFRYSILLPTSFQSNL